MGLLDIFNREDKTSEILKQGGVVIDVRSPGEFQSGHVKGSKNIPLGEISSNVEQIKKMKKPVVLCCASGMRSGTATLTLRNHGVECTNGGSWTKVNRKLNEL